MKLIIKTLRNLAQRVALHKIKKMSTQALVAYERELALKPHAKGKWTHVHVRAELRFRKRAAENVLENLQNAETIDIGLS